MVFLKLGQDEFDFIHDRGSRRNAQFNQCSDGSGILRTKRPPFLSIELLSIKLISSPLLPLLIRFAACAGWSKWVASRNAR